MSREAHVRFCEGVGVKFPCATRRGLPTDPPPLSPARFRGQMDFFEETLGSAETPTWRAGPQRYPSNRGPPEEERGEWTAEIEESASSEDWGA